MRDTPQRELATAVLRDASRRYIKSRRGRIDAFVDRHFTFAGSVALHRRALGWDLARAPANLFLAGPALCLKLVAWAARRGGLRQAAAWLARRQILLETEVAREMEWLITTELLEIPCRQRDREAHRDAVAEAILSDERVASRLLPTPLAELAAGDAELRSRVAAAIETYLQSRTASAEVSTGFVSAGVGALIAKQTTPGLVTLSSVLAATIAQQMAIAAFPLGASLGGLWYGLFPATASRGLLVVTTAGVFLAGAVLAAFSGIITDPLQRRLGLHRKRLERLLKIVEAELSGETAQGRTICDHYVARLVDVFDLIALAVRASHA